MDTASPWAASPHPIDLSVPIPERDGPDLSGVPVARIEQVRQRGALIYVSEDEIDWACDVIASWDLRGSVWERRLAAHFFVELRPGLFASSFALVTPAADRYRAAPRDDARP